MRAAIDSLGEKPHQILEIQSDAFEKGLYATTAQKQHQPSKLRAEMGKEILIQLDSSCAPQRIEMVSHERVIKFPKHNIQITLPNFFKKISTKQDSIIFAALGPRHFKFPMKLSLATYDLAPELVPSLLNRKKVIREHEWRFYQVLQSDSATGPTGTLYRLVGKHKIRFRKKLTHESFFLRKSEKQDRIDVFHLSITCEYHQYDWLKPVFSEIESRFLFTDPSLSVL